MKHNSPRVQKLIKDSALHMCLECGKCSASCPRLIAGQEYSPRLVAQRLMFHPEDTAYVHSAVWECLTCGVCEERCPSGVKFSQFILEMREVLAAEQGILGYRAHDGALHSWMRIMTSPELKQNRLEWLTPDLKVAETGKTAFFTGCSPYFDVFFSNIEVDTLSLAKDSIRLLNRLELEPVVLGNERCCGHDLLWTGDRENFEDLCRLNYQEFMDHGVEEVVTACPECYLVLHDYLPQVVPESRLKVTLLLDLLAERAEQGKLAFKPLERRVTYQDPCRLGRMAGRYEEPRSLLKSIPGLELEEMESSRQSSLCCGNSSFVNCDAFSKRVQVERLKQARETQAETLVTACPKCMIHTTCAMRDPYKGESLAMQVRGLVNLLADQME